MSQDELAIRALVNSWMESTKRGDIQAVLDLMTEDALFLVAGQPPMNKEAFEAASRSQATARLHIDSHSEVKEVVVEGPMAYMWSHLTVAVTPEGTEDAIRRAGHTLTVFRKVDGRWLLCRDANMLVKV